MAGLRPNVSIHQVLQPSAIIAVKRQQLSWLGEPSGPAFRTPNGAGWFQHFQNGSIYWSPGTGAWEVHGAIRDKWAAMGWETSFLGFPLTDESATPDGSGRFNHFQGGSIYWSPQTGAQEVHGAIRDHWASLGWERSFLGYPVSDEFGLQGTDLRASNFQRGQIAWSPARGASVSATSFVPNQGGGIAPLGLGPSGVPEVRRRVVISAHMDILDHETFGSNEHGSADAPPLEFIITNGFPQETLRLIGVAGDEVRVELVLSCQANLSGDVTVTGQALLFEGTSDQTTDLDGRMDVAFVAPRDNFVSKAYRVANQDEGDDFADIRLTASNFAA